MKAHRLNDVRNDLSLDEGFRRRRQQMPLIVANSGQSAKELLELVGELPSDTSRPPGCGWPNLDVAIFRRAVALLELRLWWAATAEAK